MTSRCDSSSSFGIMKFVHPSSKCILSCDCSTCGLKLYDWPSHNGSIVRLKSIDFIIASAPAECVILFLVVTVFRNTSVYAFLCSILHVKQFRKIDCAHGF